MILSRVIKHFRKQEWTAIVIDFLIVVFGVFIGFQLTEWSAERELRAQEGETLVRLHAEADAIVRYFHRIIESEGEQNDHSEYAVSMLFEPVSLDEIDAERVTEGLRVLSHYQAVSPQRAVYDELRSDGRLARLGDESVRAAIAEYYRELIFLEGQLEYFRTGASEHTAFLGDAYTVDFHADAEQRFERRFDVEALRVNRAYKTAVASALRNQFVFQFYRRRALGAAENMCRELARATRLACESLSEAAE